jgi:PIN domain nuclease of toxin-antitoxin system
MKLLLDTHALLWYLHDDAKLSSEAKSLISEPTNTLLISPISYWELAIKASLKKLVLKTPVIDLVREATADLGATILPIEPRHVVPLETMPFHHRDPFDRLLIAQAMVESIPVVSADTVFDSYRVSRLW